MTKSDAFLSAQNKLARYDAASNELMLDAMEFDDVYNAQFSLPEIVYLLRNTFKERITRKEVLGETEFRPNTDPSSGFCMIASYLIYSMTGGDKVWELHGTFLHWWLYHKQSHTIFDVTYTQFNDKELQAHYKKGRPVSRLKTDPMFYDILMQKSQLLAKRAGLAKRE